MDAITAILITAYAVAAFVILPLWYRSLRYILSADEITICSGILIEKRTYVKFSAIQYITIVRYPVFFRINVNTILINVYGKGVGIKFLTTQNLEEIDKIIRINIEEKR